VDPFNHITKEQLESLRSEYASYLPPPPGSWEKPKWPWEQMAVGDSVFITSECRCYKSLFNMLNALRKRTGKRFRIFSVDTLKSQWRIWRVV
jgi:hypothetical protein